MTRIESSQEAAQLLFVVDGTRNPRYGQIATRVNMHLRSHSLSLSLSLSLFLSRTQNYLVKIR